MLRRENQEFEAKPGNAGRLVIKNNNKKRQAGRQTGRLADQPGAVVQTRKLSTEEAEPGGAA